MHHSSGPLLMHFVRFYFESPLPLENFDQEECGHRVPELVIKVPDGAFAFRFYDQIKSHVWHNGKEYVARTNFIEPSVTYYYQGTLYTAAQVEEQFPDMHDLIVNIRAAGYDRVIKTRTGSWEPFKPGDGALQVTLA